LINHSEWNKINTDFIETTFIDDCQQIYKAIIAVREKGMKSNQEIGNYLGTFFSTVEKNQSGITMRVKVANVIFVMENPMVREYITDLCTNIHTQGAIGFQVLNSTTIKSVDMITYGEAFIVSFLKK
jgi:hypothetical protein